MKCELLCTGLIFSFCVFLHYDSLISLYLENNVDNFPRYSLHYLGCWNANLNVPMITSSLGNPGDMYIVCVSGFTSIDENANWKLGDKISFEGNVNKWEKNVHGVRHFA